MTTQHAIYKSECGAYLCRFVRWGGHYEAWTSDGAIHWQDDSRIQTKEDRARYPYPLAYCVGSYSAARYDQPKGSFTLQLLHCDTTQRIEPFTGNTVREARAIVFRRKVPRQHWPRWLRAYLASLV